MAKGTTKNTTQTKLSMAFNHNTRFYIQYRMEALRALEGDTSAKKIETAKKAMKKRYKDMNPFDPTETLEGIPSEAKEIFEAKQLELLWQLHEPIIDEVFKDIQEGNHTPDFESKTVLADMNKQDALTQIKYFELAAKNIEEQIIRNIKNDMLSAKDKPFAKGLESVFDMAAERVEQLLRINFEADDRGLESIIDDNTEKFLGSIKDEKTRRAAEEEVEHAKFLGYAGTEIEKLEEILNDYENRTIRFNPENESEVKARIEQAIEDILALTKRTTQPTTEEKSKNIQSITERLLEDLSEERAVGAIAYRMNENLEIARAKRTLASLKQIDMEGLSEESRNAFEEAAGEIGRFNLVKDMAEKNSLTVLVNHGLNDIIMKEAQKQGLDSEELKSFAKDTITAAQSTIVNNNITQALRIVKREVRDIDMDSTDFETILGLSNFNVQLSKFGPLLNGERMKISYNFFNEKRNLIWNSFTFLTGWTLEIGTKHSMEDLLINKGEDVKLINPNEWDGIAHHLGIAKYYFHEKKKALTTHINLYKGRKADMFDIEGTEMKGEDIRNQLKAARTAVEETENRIRERIIHLFLTSKENPTESIMQVLEEEDSRLHSGEATAGMEKLFMKPKTKEIEEGDPKKEEKEKKQQEWQENYEKGIGAYVKTYSKQASQINKAISEKAKNPNAKLENEEDEYAFYNYTKNSRISTMDAVSHIKGDIIEAFEMKNLKVDKSRQEDGTVKLPVVLSMQTRGNRELMGEIFNIYGKPGKERYTFRVNNTESMKEKQDEIFNKQTNRLNKLSEFNIEKENVYYICNIIDEERATSDMYKIPLEAFENVFLDQEFFDNAELEQGNGWKFSALMKVSFFREQFKEHLISKANTAKKTSAKQP